MKLPESMTTVTTFSKIVALSLFIVIPILTFILGSYYQQEIANGVSLVVVEPVSEETKDIAQEVVIEDPSTPEVELAFTCGHYELGVYISLPASAECTLSVESSSLTIEYDIFSIYISSLGRGPYCGDGPNEEGSICEVTDFYSNDNLSVRMYNFNGEDKEIFGSLVEAFDANEGSSYAVITYEDMENTPLTDVQMDTLTTILDSIK